jgi:hypothetical protein
MPSLFQEHELQRAAERMNAAAKSGAEPNLADAKLLRDHLSGVVKKLEANNSVEAARKRKLEAALSDPEAPVVRQALKTLDRLGLTPYEAAELNKLNAAMDSRRWSTEERFRTKALLHSVGII